MTAHLPPHSPATRRSAAGAPTRSTGATLGPTLAAVLLLAALSVAAWPLMAPPAGPGIPWLAALAHICGMLAGFGVLVLLLLAARVPALERHVGSDVVLRWHARLGRTVIVLVLVHAWAAIGSWADSRQQDWWTSTWNVLRLPALPTATVGTVLMAAAGFLSARSARRRVTHETWHAVHLLMYIAVALSFGHQLAGPDLVGHVPLQIGWASAYAYVFAIVVWFRLVSPVRQATRHRLRVVAVRPEGDNVVSIVVEGRNLDALNAAPGQFFRWRFLTPDQWKSAHPFSISAPATATHLRLTVKGLGDGSLTLQRVPVGTWVVAEGPYGAITPARRTAGDVLLIAGGVGITPIRVLFEAMPLGPGEDMLLLYRTRGPSDIVFGAELAAIAAARGVRLLYVFDERRDVLSAEGLQRVVPDIAHRDVFLCGPPGLASALRTSLRAVGVPKRRVHEERFSF